MEKQQKAMGMPFDWHLPGVKPQIQGIDTLAPPQTPAAVDPQLKQL